MEELIYKLTRLEYEGDASLPPIGAVRHILERVKYNVQSKDDAIANIEILLPEIEELIQLEDTYTKREGKALITNALDLLRSM